MEILEKKFLINNSGYTFNFLLTCDYDNIGIYNTTNVCLLDCFVDSVEYEEGNIIIPFINEPEITTPLVNYSITGITMNRLSEVEKFTISNDIEEKYIISDGVGNGVILEDSDETQIKYIIDGITFITYLEDMLTMFTFISNGLTDLNTVNGNIIKIDKLLDINDKPRIKTDLNVIRQEIQVFNNIYYLNNIDSLNELETFGGSYFNIIFNS